MARTGTTFAALLLIALGIALLTIVPYDLATAGLGILSIVMGIILFVLVMIEQYRKGRYGISK